MAKAHARPAQIKGERARLEVSKPGVDGEQVARQGAADLRLRVGHRLRGVVTIVFEGLERLAPGAPPAAYGLRPGVLSQARVPADAVEVEVEGAEVMTEVVFEGAASVPPGAPRSLEVGARVGERGVVRVDQREPSGASGLGVDEVEGVVDLRDLVGVREPGRELQESSRGEQGSLEGEEIDVSQRLLECDARQDRVEFGEIGEGARDLCAGLARGALVPGVDRKTRRALGAPGVEGRGADGGTS